MFENLELHLILSSIEGIFIFFKKIIFQAKYILKTKSFEYNNNNI